MVSALWPAIYTIRNGNGTAKHLLHSGQTHHNTIAMTEPESSGAIPSGYHNVAKGWTSTIYRPGHTGRVVKVLTGFAGIGPQAYFDRERSIYERLWFPSSNNTTPPQAILQYFGPDPHFATGLTLEWATSGNLNDYVWKHTHIPENQLIRWAHQAAEGLHYIHTRNILHCDIYVSNFFLDDNLNLRIGDFGASSIDEVSPLLMYRSTHQLWKPVEDGDPSKDGSGFRKDYSVRSEIFALGSAIYHMGTGHDLWEAELEQERDKVELCKRMQGKKMLGMEKEMSVLGEVVKKCWQVEYESMKDVVEDIEKQFPMSFRVDSAPPVGTPDGE